MDIKGRIDFMFFEQLLEITTIANLLQMDITDVDLVIFELASEKKLRQRTYKLEVR